MFLFLIAALATVSAGLPLSQATWLYNSNRPLVIAQGGSSGQFPELTSAAISDAYFNGADFVHVTVQMTLDKILILNSNLCLGEATNATQGWTNGTMNQKKKSVQFAGGSSCTNDFIVTDFNLTQIKTLRRKQRQPYRNQALNGVFPIMTLNETIKLIKNLQGVGRSIGSPQMGLIIELMENNWYTKLNMTTAQAVFQILDFYNISTVQETINSNFPIVISASDDISLLAFKKINSDLPLLKTLLGDYNPLLYDFQEISSFANGVRCSFDWLVKSQNGLFQQSEFVKQLHSFNMTVFPFTLKDDRPQVADSTETEISLLVLKGIDGLHTDFTHSTYKLLSLIGSRSYFPLPPQSGSSTLKLHSSFIKLDAEKSTLILQVVY